MMKIDVVLLDAASGAEPKPVVRETTRMAILGECLSRIGHNVRLCHPNRHLMASGRWRHFKHLEGRLRAGADARIVASEAPEKWTRGCNGLTVRYKTRVNNRQDTFAVQHSDIFMTHEMLAAFRKRKDVLPIPFIVGDTVVEHMMKYCNRRGEQFEYAWNAYLSNDLHTVRRSYLSDVTVSDCVGFFGFGGYGRSETCAAVSGSLQSDVVLYETKPLGPVEYMQRVGSWGAGLCLEGVTPKCNRFSELALMGVPIVITNRESQPLRPMLSDDNCVTLLDLDDVTPIRDAIANRAGYVARQDEAYRQGWSPLGQANQLTHMLESKL